MREDAVAEIALARAIRLNLEEVRGALSALSPAGALCAANDIALLALAVVQVIPIDAFGAPKLSTCTLCTVL